MLRNRHLYTSAYGLLLACLMAGSTVAGSVAREGSASIQATAQVMPALGMTEIEPNASVVFRTVKSPEPGSHLFWLYCPKLNGIQVQIDSPKGLKASFDDPDGDRAEPARLQFLTQYLYASLVKLEELPREPDTSRLITITVLFTDN